LADVYGAVTDDAIGRMVDFLHVRAPYLFNYVAPSIRPILDQNQKVTGYEDVWLTCFPVPDSPIPGTPKYRRVEPFGVPGIPIKLPFCVQIVDAKVDFHPGDLITLRPELLPPLAPQHFALYAQASFGLACIPAQLVEWYVQQQHLTHALFKSHFTIPVLPVDDLICFSLEFQATGRLRVETQSGFPTPVDKIRVELGRLELIDIAPPGLEAAIECYLVAMIRGYIVPQLVLALEPLVVRSLGLTVNSRLAPNLPNNPAIEQNELRVWLDVDIA
jgi:hypothetical protein